MTAAQFMLGLAEMLDERLGEYIGDSTCPDGGWRIEEVNCGEFEKDSPVCHLQMVLSRRKPAAEGIGRDYILLSLAEGGVTVAPHQKP
jgi:hypothetical protein